MARSVLLFSGGWSDLPLETLAQLAADWGYHGLDLACWGDHLEVQRALDQEEYCSQKLALLNRLDLGIPVVSAHRVSQAVCDRVEARHRSILPDYVWGDGQPDGVRQRAIEEMMATVRAAQQLGAAVLAGFSGSPLWGAVLGYPAATPALVDEALREFQHLWGPILDQCREAGIRYALEVHPGQLAFDLYSAECLLDVMQAREEFGFLLDPSHLHWQGIDPVEFIRRFGERIYHVHIKDIAVRLNGRSGLLGSYLPYGDPRRGWEFRSPGRGDLDWEAILRALNEVGYDGPLCVEWSDAGMNREQGAEEACRFLKQLDFDPPPRPARSAFQ
jgi:sugar phosphate isomerase/epimerase